MSFIFNEDKINLRDYIHNAKNNSKIRWVSVQDIENSLPKNPINVGFDVDDTLVYSSVVFYYLQKKFNIKDVSKYPNELWTEASNLDKDFSLPKKSAIKIVQMHKNRGDNIYFITGRVSPKTETLTKTLEEIFDIKSPSPTIFTGEVPHQTKYEKTPFLQKHNINIYYGDSDIDILSSNECSIRGIRFLRATNSITKPVPHAGIFGEEVLISSDY